MGAIQEKILIVKLKGRDTDSFAKLYDLYVEKIYRFVYFKVSSVEEAEDITSETFLKAWNYLGKDDTEIRNLSSFLYQIARNLVIDFYRQRSLKETVSVDNEKYGLHELPDKNQNVIAHVSKNLASEQIQNYLARLKDEYKEVVILKHLEGYSTKEISDILGKKKGNVRVLLHRAIKAMSEIATEETKVTLLAQQKRQEKLNSPNA